MRVACGRLTQAVPTLRSHIIEYREHTFQEGDMPESKSLNVETRVRVRDRVAVEPTTRGPK